MARTTKQADGSEAEVQPAREIVYGRAQLLEMGRFSERRDVLGAVLDDGMYTLQEAESLLRDFMKGKVK